MKTQFEKAVQFRELHNDQCPFIIPNPWDVASTKLLSHFGFKALATSSAAHSLSEGVCDNLLPLDRVLDHLIKIVSATDLPVTADLGNGFFEKPEHVYNTILKAAETGIVGASIEDAHCNKVYPFDLAVERIRAAAEAVKALQFPFFLTARADNYFVGNPNLKETIRRLEAYQMAGADVLFAPGVILKDEIQSILVSVDRPLNVLVGINNSVLTFNELSKIGVKRISLGATLYRTAMSSFIKSVQNLCQTRQFDFADNILSYQEINTLLS